MQPILGKFEEPIYSVTRFVVGALFLCHGAQKIFGAFGATPKTGDPLMLIGGLIELVGGAFIAVGLFTSVSAFFASGMMAVAYFKAHAPQDFWPIVNKGELAVVYCFLFLFVAAHGAGAYSVDNLLLRRTSWRHLPRPHEPGYSH